MDSRWMIYHDVGNVVILSYRGKIYGNSYSEFCDAKTDEVESERAEWRHINVPPRDHVIWFACLSVACTAPCNRVRVPPRTLGPCLSECPCRSVGDIIGGSVTSQSVSQSVISVGRIPGRDSLTIPRSALTLCSKHSGDHGKARKHADYNEYINLLFRPPPRGTSAMCCDDVCLFCRLSIHQILQMLHETWSILFWRRYDTLCTFGFADNVMFLQ